METKNYRYLLFDADDTLLDFKAAERAALDSLFKQVSIELTPKIREQYMTINHSLWAAFERSEITRDDVLHTRFKKLFEELNVTVPDINLEKTYQDLLASGHQTMADVFEVLDALKDKYELYIVSNGVATTQYSRLHASGLYPYFKSIFVSEDTGYQKPQIEFFEYVAVRIPDFDPSKALIIGDSLSSDIQGGVNAKIDTCWMNPGSLENKKQLPITFEIKGLKDLLPILLG